MRKRRNRLAEVRIVDTGECGSSERPSESGLLFYKGEARVLRGQDPNNYTTLNVRNLGILSCRILFVIATCSRDDLYYL